MTKDERQKGFKCISHRVDDAVLFLAIVDKTAKKSHLIHHNEFQVQYKSRLAHLIVAFFSPFLSMFEQYKTYQRNELTKLVTTNTR